MSPLPKKAPVVTLDPVATKLATLGLDYPASCLPDLVEQCTREQLSPVSFLELVLTGELERKDERRVTTMLKLSGLPTGKTLEDFDWSFQPRVDRRQIETLATCSYIREKTNVLFLGPPGVGKSHLATALGVLAHSVRVLNWRAKSTTVSRRSGGTHRCLSSPQAFFSTRDTPRTPRR
ncbi:MAG TPA: ATP-binding protein [Gemmatimonadaceae bacterium]|nr:ATP-binding protein [Gemmatimonadaceae bacterium]